MYIKTSRELVRLKNVLSTFADFNFDHLVMNEQLFNDYKSQDLDLYKKVKTDHQKEKVSILDDVDFELEVIQHDEIYFAYILIFMANIKYAKYNEMKQKEIIDLIAGEVHLRSKRELIERFIKDNMPSIEDADTIPDEFERFWNEE